MGQGFLSRAIEMTGEVEGYLLDYLILYTRVLYGIRCHVVIRFVIRYSFYYTLLINDISHVYKNINYIIAIYI